MKKKAIKPLRKIALDLPVRFYPLMVKPLMEYTKKDAISRPWGYRQINHVRRMKRAFKQYGQIGVDKYIAKYAGQ